MKKKTMQELEELEEELDEDEQEEEEIVQKVIKKTPKQEGVKITQVVTETQQAFKLPDGTVVGLNEYLVWLGNQVAEIKNAVA